MRDDALTLVLVRLDEPVTVRPAFAAELRRVLRAELGFASEGTAAELVAPSAAVVPATTVERAPVTVPPLRRLRAMADGLRAAFRPMTPRLALLLLLALLLVACTLAGAVIVVREWLSTGERGIQYTNDFALAEVYRAPGAGLEDLQVGPDGQTLYAVRESFPDAPPTEAAVVRLAMAADGTVSSTTVVSLESLRQAALWPAGTDLSSGTVVGGPRGPGDRGPLSVAPGGDIYLSLGLSTDPQRTPVATTVVVIHPDGSVDPVLSIATLAAEGLFEHPVNDGWVNVTASAPGRLWARAEASVVDAPAGSYVWLLEVTDPNRDGDWSDRVVKHLVLPTDIPSSAYGEYVWWYGGFVAERSTPGHDRSASVLLPLVNLKSGEYRIYRVADPNSDGDAMDPGETSLLFTGSMGDPNTPLDAPMLAPRLVDGSSPSIDEFVAAGLSRGTRLSRITAAGVVDIARAIPSVWGVAPTRDGAIYLASWEPGAGANRLPGSIVVHRLTPVPSGAPVPTDRSSPAPTVQPTPAPRFIERQPVVEDTERIGVWYAGTSSSGEDFEEVVLYGADGGGPADLAPPGSAEFVCPSADGRRLAFASDEEVPNEFYLYVADVGGANKALVDEQVNMVVCPFPREAIATLVTGNYPWQLTWHPFGGTPSKLVPDVALDGLLTASRNGTRVALATGWDGRTLTIVDVVRGEARSVGGTFASRIRRAEWSADASHLVVATGAWEPTNTDPVGRFELWLVDVASGAVTHLASSDGRAPWLAWSTDGRSISVEARDGADADQPGKLFVIEVATGARRLVIKDAIFAGWSPVAAHTLAYASRPTLTIERDGVVVNAFPGPTGKVCPVCQDRPEPSWPWFTLGWSPDGRYIGTGWDANGSVIGLVDVLTGEYRVMATDLENTVVIDARWWP